MANVKPIVAGPAQFQQLQAGDTLLVPAVNRGNGFVSWTGEATVTSATSVALVDSTGAPLSPTKTYKVAACNIDSSAQRGAVALFVGDGSAFTLKTVYEQGTSSSNVRIYLNAGVPSVSVYGGSGSYRIPYLIEEVPNFGQALSEFGILQRLLDAPTDGTTYGRKDGSWVSISGGGISDAPSDGKYYGRRNGAWEQVGQPGVIAITASVTLDSTYLNKVLEANNTSTLTLTIPPGLGAQGDMITVVHSKFFGQVTVARGSGVQLWRIGSSGDHIIDKYGMMTFYKTADANIWTAA